MESFEFLIFLSFVLQPTFSNRYKINDPLTISGVTLFIRTQKQKFYAEGRAGMFL